MQFHELLLVLLQIMFADLSVLHVANEHEYNGITVCIYTWLSKPNGTTIADRLFHDLYTCCHGAKACK